MKCAFQDLYQDKLAEIGDEGNLFSKLHAFYKASTDALRVTTGKQAVNLLRKSERIQGDLQTCLRTSEPMSLVVREFVSFPVKNELRGFVYKGKLTALTQYNNLAFFPEHLDSKAEIEAKVKSFVEGCFIKAMESVLSRSSLTQTQYFSKQFFPGAPKNFCPCVSECVVVFESMKKYLSISKMGGLGRKMKDEKK